MSQKDNFLYLSAMLKVTSHQSTGSGSGRKHFHRKENQDMLEVTSWNFTWPKDTPKDRCNWDITRVLKYRNNKIINNDGAVMFHLQNWVKSVNVEIPDTNVKFCSRLIVKDDLGRTLFEAVRPSNVMVIDGDYGPVKH